MAADTLRPLLDKLKEHDARREADRRTRYAKLVLRVARGDDLGGPEQITTAVNALGRDIDEFQADIESAAERIELRAVADQLAERTAAKDAAFNVVEAAKAAYLAESRRLEEEHTARIAAARAAYQTAAALAEAANQATQKLITTCRDVEVIERIQELGKARVALRERIAKHRASASRVEDDAENAMQIERRRASGVPLGHTPIDTPQSEERRLLIAEAPALIAAQNEAVAQLQAQLAELDAEVSNLEARLLEPFPGVTSSRS